MLTIRRSIMIKCIPKSSIEMDINKLFYNFGECVKLTLNHIRGMVEKYERIKKEGKCSECGEKTVLYHKKGNRRLCLKCFSKLWSEFTLLMSYKDELMKQYPKLSSAHQGYYRGAVSQGVKIYKSYLRKKQQRDFEIKRAKDNTIAIQAKINDSAYEIKKTKIKIKKGKNLTDELNKSINESKRLVRDLKQESKRAKRKKISFPKFSSNEIYFGNVDMFVFTKKYSLGITDFKEKRNKIYFDLRIGNYQKQFIDKCIEKEQHKVFYPKIIRRRKLSEKQAFKKKKPEFEYYFILPTRDMADVETSQEKIKKLAKKRDAVVCSLSFGIKRPVTLVVFKNKKIIDVKHFGSGKLYWKNERERNLRAKIYNTIGERYRHNHPHKTKKDKRLHQKKRNALRKINDKLGFRNLRFTNFANQKLSFEVIDYIKKNYPKSVIVMRDTKKIKDISYRGEYMKRLSRWSIAEQKTFLTYKSFLNEIPIYLIPYNKSNLVKCSKCSEENGEKVTTEKLKFTKEFACTNEKCNYRQNFAQNDAINLFQTFIKEK